MWFGCKHEFDIDKKSFDMKIVKTCKKCQKIEIIDIPCNHNYELTDRYDHGKVGKLMHNGIRMLVINWTEIYKCKKCGNIKRIDI